MGGRTTLLPPQSTYMYRSINTARREWEDGEWAIQLQQPTATNWTVTNWQQTPFLPSSFRVLPVSVIWYLTAVTLSFPPASGDNRPSTLVSHWVCILSLTYYATLCGAFDRNQWSRSAVADVTIIDHFVRGCRQAPLKGYLYRQHLCTLR